MNSAWVPFSELVMYDNISEFGGTVIRGSVAASLESPAMYSSVIIDSPTCHSALPNVNTGVGGGSEGLEERINNSTRRIDRERARLQRAAGVYVEKVAGLRRKVGDLSSEIVNARDGVECRKEEVLGLESQVEAVADLIGPLEAENMSLKTNLNKAYQRESRKR